MDFYVITWCFYLKLTKAIREIPYDKWGSEKYLMMSIQYGYTAGVLSIYMNVVWFVYV